MMEVSLLLMPILQYFVREGDVLAAGDSIGNVGSTDAWIARNCI